MIKAALFDLDGVVFDTESQYSVFWGMIGREYHPEMPDFALRIKGQTLVQIYDKYFSDDATFAHIDGYADCKSEQAKITARLDEFELNMSFPYIPGFETFLKDLKAHGVKCAVVTSSNLQKMEQVYKHHPEFKTYFDRVLTSEDFAKSKPDPDCYLKGAGAKERSSILSFPNPSPTVLVERLFEVAIFQVKLAKNKCSPKVLLKFKPACTAIFSEYPSFLVYCPLRSLIPFSS